MMIQRKDLRSNFLVKARPNNQRFPEFAISEKNGSECTSDISIMFSVRAFLCRFSLFPGCSVFNQFQSQIRFQFTKGESSDFYYARRISGIVSFPELRFSFYVCEAVQIYSYILLENALLMRGV